MSISSPLNACIKCNESLGNDDSCWNPACSLAGIHYTNVKPRDGVDEQVIHQATSLVRPATKFHCNKCNESTAVVHSDDRRCANIDCDWHMIQQPLHEVEENNRSRSLSSEPSRAESKPRPNQLKSMQAVKLRHSNAVERIRERQAMREQEDGGSVLPLAGLRARADYGMTNLKSFLGDRAVALYLTRDITQEEYYKLIELLNIAIQGYHESMANRCAKPQDIPAQYKAPSTDPRMATVNLNALLDAEPRTGPRRLLVQELADLIDNAYQRDLTLREFTGFIVSGVNTLTQRNLYAHEVDDMVLRMSGNSIESHWNNTPLR